MLTEIIKLGTFNAVSIPTSITEKLNLTKGAKMAISVINGNVVLSRVSSSPLYKLEDLLRKCQLGVTPEKPYDLSDWENAKAVG